MLIINNKEINVIEQNIKVSKFILNGTKGYEVSIALKFKDLDKEGYLNLSAGYEMENKFDAFLNKIYKGIPFECEPSQINFFEIFDTENFYDTEIESEITLIIKNINDNKIKTYFELDDELIKLKYDGELNIIKANDK